MSRLFDRVLGVDVYNRSGDRVFAHATVEYVLPHGGGGRSGWIGDVMVTEGTDGRWTTTNDRLEPVEAT